MNSSSVTETGSGGNLSPFNPAIHKVLTGLGYEHKPSHLGFERERGEDKDGTKGGSWDRYYGPDGETVLIFANGEIVTDNGDKKPDADEKPLNQKLHRLLTELGFDYESEERDEPLKAYDKYLSPIVEEFGLTLTVYPEGGMGIFLSNVGEV